MKFAIGILALMIAGGVVLYYATLPSAPEPVACTADAMQCPDGSYVGRSGPNCEFVCPDTNGNQGFAPYNSGIRGLLVAGSTCPVETIEEPCPDKPVSTTVAIFRQSDAVHAVAILKSEADGTFEVSLPPGEYVVGAGEGRFPTCPQTPVVVIPAEYAEITIGCDTGIR